MENENRIIKDLLVNEIDDCIIALNELVQDFNNSLQEEKLSEYFLDATQMAIENATKKLVVLRKIQEKYKED